MQCAYGARRPALVYADCFPEAKPVGDSEGRTIGPVRRMVVQSYPKAVPQIRQTW
jgi:hypothetical protein